jgi:hypothetical protein
MAISLCKHAFPLQPPHGSLVRPGDCTRCAVTFAAAQDGLRRQADTIRIRTAHEGACESCGRDRMLFAYQRARQPLEEHEPPVLRLCIPCWGRTRETEERTGFTDYRDAFAHATDRQLARFLGGGPR